MKIDNIKLSIVIPTYKSSDFIISTLEDLFKNMSKFDESWELILVDDSSPDSTFHKVRSFICEKNIKYQIIQLMKNVGQNAALFSGIIKSRGEFVLTMDDDMEVPASEIIKIYNEIKDKDDIDVLIGIAKNDDRGFIRRSGTILHNHINNFFFKVNFQASGFRIIKRNIINSVITFKTKSPHLGFLLIKTTNKIENFYICKNKGARNSNYSILNLIQLFVWNTINYTSLPLDFVSNIGLFTSILSTLYGVFILIQYLTGIPWPIENPGWTSLIVTVCFFSGLILFSLGIIGKYIMRMIYELSNGEISYNRRIETNEVSDHNFKKVV